MRSPARLFPLLASFALLLSGCGASPEERLRADAGKMLDAMEQRNGKAFCDLLDPASQKYVQRVRGLTYTDCASGANYVFRATPLAELQSSAASTRKALAKAQIKIQGDRGTIPLPEQSPLVARQVNGKWRFRLNLPTKPGAAPAAASS